MLRRLLLLPLLLTVLLASGRTAKAGEKANAWLTYPLNLRAGPAEPYPALHFLPAGSGLTLTARNGNTRWLLGESADANGSVRGWVPAAFVSYADGFDPASLPISRELIEQSPALPHDRLAPDIVDAASGNPNFVQTRAAAINLSAYPIIPESTGQARAIFERGQTLGRAPDVVTKVGDCNSTEWLFLHPFGENQYDLGPYTELQGVVDHFGASFVNRTYAAYNGLNAAAVLDPIWSDPAICQSGETPLECEIRVHNPSLAVIMFGTNDILVLSPEEYDYNLRRVLNVTIQAGVIPLLSTFPRHLTFPDRSILYNQIVVRVALDYDIPLENLWLALEPLPTHGIANDQFHLDGPLTRAGDLRTPSNLQTGYPLRNLVTLQALDVIWRSAMR